MEPKERLIVALDTDSEKAYSLVAQLKAQVGLFKIGFRLFLTYGTVVVWEVLERGGAVFLDLKFHDLPRQVEDVSRQVAELDVSMFTVHCLGGIEMMAAARKGVASSQSERTLSAPTAILGTTILTHHDYQSLLQLGLVRYISDRAVLMPEAVKRLHREEIQQRVVQLALDAKEAGMDGVVSSPEEVTSIRRACGPDFLIVTAGIHHAGSVGIGHRRIGSASEAIRDGADYVVVGSLIAHSSDPVRAATSIVEEIAAAMAERR